MISALEQTFIDEAQPIIREHVTNGAAYVGEKWSPSLLLTAKLLGMLEERNRCSLEEIVKVAERARREAMASACPNCSGLHVDRIGDPGPMNCVSYRIITTTIDFAEWLHVSRFDAPAFFRSIARESLGLGKVFDEFAVFPLTNNPCRHCGAQKRGTTIPASWCVTCGRDGQFSVPRLTTEPMEVTPK